MSNSAHSLSITTAYFSGYKDNFQGQLGRKKGKESIELSLALSLVGFTVEEFHSSDEWDRQKTQSKLQEKIDKVKYLLEFLKNSPTN